MGPGCAASVSKARLWGNPDISFPEAGGGAAERWVPAVGFLRQWMEAVHLLENRELTGLLSVSPLTGLRPPTRCPDSAGSMSACRQEM